MNTVESPDSSLIAVTALDCRFPGAPDTEAFWDLLLSERHGLTRHTLDELTERGVPPRLREHPAYVPVGGVIDDQDRFDPEPFGLTDTEAALMDPQQRLFLEACWRALEAAGHGNGIGAGAVGVFAGAAHSDYLMRNLAHRYTSAASDPVGSLQTAMATVGDYLPLQVAHRLGLTGPAIAVNTTCSTSLVAVHLAAQSLLAGECDTALAGGASLIVPQGLGYLYVPDGIFSIDGLVRAFSADGTGIVHSQGVGVAVLRRLADARADGDPVLAVLHGSAVNNDGADKTGFTAPSPRGQARVITEALAVAGVEARQISYVEAHGTATRLGDVVEISALRRVFGSAGPAWCALGSVKSNIGHANSAAGIAGFAKTVLALHHGVLPATLDAEPLNPELHLDDSPFTVARRTADWPGTRYAGVSSFGIGGTNCHIVLGSAPAVSTPEPDPRPQLVLLSATSDAALAESVTDVADTVHTTTVAPADLAYTLHSGRPIRRHRVAAVVTGDRVGDSVALRTAVRRAAGASMPKVVFVFPGAGTQYPGMGRGLMADEPEFADTVRECGALFDEPGRPRLTELIEADRADPAALRLARDPAYGLPALFTVSLATARVLIRWGIRPDVVVGHSLGEYVAAVVAGALSVADAAALVRVRSRGMSRTAGQGAMLVVALSETEVVTLLTDHPDVDLAAVNAPTSCLVSGAEEAVAVLEARLVAKGVQTTRLRLDAGAHSRLVDPVLPELRAAASDVDARTPLVPLASTLTGGFLTSAPAAGHWAPHLRSVVRFSDALTTAIGDGPAVVVQTGPGSGLLQLARQHPAVQLAATIATFPEPDEPGDERATLLAAAGDLWTWGVGISAEALHRSGRRRVMLPGHPFDRRRLWIDPPEPEAVPTADAPDENEPFQVPVWLRVPMPDDSAAITGRWLLDGPEGDPLVEAIRMYLGAAGAQVIDRAEVAADATIPCAGVVVLDLAPDGDEPAARVTGAVLRHAELARLTATWAHDSCLLHVTRAAQQVESSDRPNPASAAGTAVPRVLAQEFPGLRWRTVDLPVVGPPDELACRVAEEAVDLVTGDLTGAEVALRGRHRWLRTVNPWRPRSEGPTDRMDAGTALLIGGLGDVGLTMAEHLAERGWQVVVTGRTGLPLNAAPDSPAAARLEAVRRLTDRGLPVEVRAVDAGDPEATGALLRDIVDRFGRVDLVVHGAGVVASTAVSPLRAVDPEAARGHARAKVSAAVALRRTLVELPEEARPHTVMLMSSATTLVGGLGLAPYAAANRYLDALAEHQGTAGGTVWLSVAWDGWRVGPGGTERAVASRHSIGRRDGMRALDRLLALTSRGRAPALVAVSPAELRPRLSGEAVDARRQVASGMRNGVAENGARGDAEAALAKVWSELLGFDVSDRDADFFALGGHSLLATRMLARLRDEHGVQLRLQDLLARPTVASLAALLPTADESDPTGDTGPSAGTASPAGPEFAEAGPNGDGPREFPLTRVQHAYWVGGSGGYRLGDVPCSFHLEHDCPGLDVARYEDAWNAVIARHPMLRAIITPEGRNRILDRVPRYRIRVRDLSALDEPVRLEKLARIRAEMVGREPRPGRWPLVDIRAARLPGGIVRLFVNVDVLVCDTASFLLWDRELRALYEDPHVELPRVGTTFAACVAALERRAHSPERERAARYWRDRLERLPGAPALPVRPAQPGIRPRFVRRTARLEPAQWQALRAEAARRSLTPTAVLLAAYGDALAVWSRQGRFAITLTLFDRPPVHPDVNLVVGDFTSLLMHEVDRSRPGTFADDAGEAQRTLFRDLDHREFSALEALAEKSARSGVTESVPVVFTSALGLTDPLGGEHDLDWMGKPVYGISSTPQTWLDHQVIEQHGALLLQWDVLENVLPADEADEAFSGYVDRVRRLAGEAEEWDAPRPAGPSAAGQSAPTGPPPGEPASSGETALLLRGGTAEPPLFLIHPSGGDVLCYGELVGLLTDDRPVVGLTDPALTGGVEPADIPALAGHYLDAVRQYQPHGPYLLGGWSMGGTLAHEMACLLERRGESTALLFMIDSNTPDRIRTLHGQGAPQNIAAVRYLHSLAAFLDLDLGFGPTEEAELHGRTGDEIRRAVTQRLRDVGLLSQRDTADLRLRVFERHLRMLGEHQAGHLSDPATRLLLVRAALPSPRNSGVGMGVDDAPDLPGLGWDGHVHGPIREVAVEGHHYSLLTGGAVTTIAKHLNETLAALPHPLRQTTDYS